MYQDLGRKESTGPCAVQCDSPEKKSEPRVYYPYLNLDTAEPIDAKADEVVECKIKLKFKGFNKSDYRKDAPYSNQFDVIAIDFGDGGPSLSEEVEEGEEGLQDAIEAGLKKTAAKKSE